MAVLSVSAPVPAVVGIVINFGNDWLALISGAFCSYSNAQRSISLFAVKQMDLPPSIALPPPMAIIASCPPEMNCARPAPISVSFGLGEISEYKPTVSPAFVR